MFFDNVDKEKNFLINQINLQLPDDIKNGGITTVENKERET